MPMPASKSNDLNRAGTALRRALKVGLELLEDPDPAARLRAIHAVAQAAGVLVRLAEMSDLEARLEALEQQLSEYRGAA